MEIRMPVGGRDETIDIPKDNIGQIIMPLIEPALPDVEEKIRAAVLNPMGTKLYLSLAHTGEDLQTMLDISRDVLKSLV